MLCDESFHSSALAGLFGKRPVDSIKAVKHLVLTKW